MTKILKHIFVAIFLIGVLTLPYFVFANPMEGLTSVATQGGYSETVSDTTFASTLGTLIGVFLGFLGIIFIVLMIWSGYNWMTAGGNEEKLTKAKSTIYRSIIGLIIIISSYAIWFFIFERVVKTVE
ncbi:MAG: hypothetical protein PF572_05575 [Patescibacteria group bacterium]|jgi:amino acid transporter|nr:hypothetical protein [Patescibacteria group bacterium]